MSDKDKVESTDPEHPRAKLHHAIRREFSNTLMQFYRANPQFMFDERSRKATSSMLGLLHAVLACVDEYEIGRKKD